ncbi:MAG: response regulator [Deltaproteobacteria bacterium]|nr:response regulator [Deltaproteobacteria bacterium]
MSDTNLKVLVVDDEEDSLELVKDTIRNLGFNVIAVSNGIEALKVLQDTSDIKVVLADLVMSGMNGIELVKEARKRGIRQKFIIITAYGEMDSYIEAMNLGVVDYINKPINSDQLIQLIAKAVEYERD